MVRASLPELKVLNTPFPLTPVGLFGLLNTLNTSQLNRMVTRSVSLKNLKSAAFWNHWFGPLIHWFRQGWRPLSKGTRRLLPSRKVSQTLLVSAKLATLVFAGAFAGRAV